MPEHNASIGISKRELKGEWYAREGLYYLHRGISKRELKVCVDPRVSAVAYLYRRISKRELKDKVFHILLQNIAYFESQKEN